MRHPHYTDLPFIFNPFDHKLQKIYILFILAGAERCIGLQSRHRRRNLAPLVFIKG